MKRIIAGIIAAAVPLLSFVPAEAAPKTIVTYGGIRPPGFGKGSETCSEDNFKGCTYNYRVQTRLKSLPCSSKTIVSSSIYNITIDRIGDEYERLVKCNAHVTVITFKNNGDFSRALTSLEKMINTKKGKSRLYPNSKIKVCKASCFDSGSKGTNHAKFIASTNGTGNYSFIESSNNNTWSGELSGIGDWSETYSHNFYNSGVAYVKAGLKDKKQSACKYKTTSEDKLSVLYFQPCSYDIASDIYKNANFKVKGCFIRAQNFYNTDSKSGRIDGLIRAKKSGCNVAVVVNKYNDNWSKKQIRRLLAAGVSVRNAQFVKNKTDYYNHAKRDHFENVKFHNKAIKVVVHGSAPATTASFTSSTNQVIADYHSNVVSKSHAESLWIDSVSTWVPYSEFCNGKYLEKKECKR